MRVERVFSWYRVPLRVLLVLACIGQTPWSGALGAQEPITPQEWIDRFEAQGALSGIRGVITPCTGANELALDVLDLLLRRSPDDRLLRDMARVLRIDWEDCPDPRIDAWLGNALLHAVESGATYDRSTLFWTIRDRSAPREYQPWFDIGFRLDLPDDVRSLALSSAVENMEIDERIDLLLRVFEEPSPPVTFLINQSTAVLTAAPDRFLSAVDPMAVMRYSSHAEGILLGTLRSVAAQRFSGIPNPASVSARAGQLLEAIEAAR